MKLLSCLAAIALSSAVAACDSARGADRPAKADQPRADSLRADSIARARQDSINRAQPGYVIDSILPVEEELRRFRAAVGGTAVTALQHASPSRKALVRRIAGDVARGDSADLRAALITPREFADLVYPSSPYTHPPYRQAPGMVWNQIQNPSASGLTRLLRRRAGESFTVVDHACKPAPEIQGRNTLWLDCTVRLAIGNDTTTQRWFGTILERDGRFKLVSYKNQF